MHKDAITAILMKRLSVFQKDLDHNAEIQVDVYQRAFHYLYWLAKEKIIITTSDLNVKRLLKKLVEKLNFLFD